MKLIKHGGKLGFKEEIKFKIIHLSNSCYIYNSFCTCTFWSFCTFIFLCQRDTRASTLLPQSIAYTTLNPPSHRSKPNNIYNSCCNQGEKYSTCQSSKAVEYDICNHNIKNRVNKTDLIGRCTLLLKRYLIL